MNEFIDANLGRMVAVASVGCKGCAYLGGSGGCLRAPQCSDEARDDGRSIIWVRAEDAPQKPKAVRLTDDQIITLRQTTRMFPGQWGDTKAFARAIESAALKANGLESGDE